MATYTDSLGFDKGTAAYPEKGSRATTMLSIDLDMVAITAARSAAGATALADNDILEVIRVPAKTLVLAVGLDVTTAEGGTCTIDVGDGATVDGYLDGVNANTVTTGGMRIDANAFSGFNGVGNFVMNSGNNNNLQGAITINIVTTAPNP